MRFGKVDLQFGGGYVFYQAVDNGGDGSIRGIMASENPTCAYGPNKQPYHSCWGVNGGKVTNKVAVVSLGAVYRFGLLSAFAWAEQRLACHRRQPMTTQVLNRDPFFGTSVLGHIEIGERIGKGGGC